MKQKILVTIGDSWTEGVGCYGGEVPKLSSNFRNNFTENLRETIELEKKYKTNFHKEGWPNRVGKKLGFDKVYNLGWGGASNSSCIKTFYNFLDEYDLTKHDVLVFWFMTEPLRFSFYNDGILHDYIPNTELDTNFTIEYLKEIKDIDKDPLLEQIFYIKVLEKTCQLNGFDLILSSWSRTLPKLMMMYPSSKYLFSTPFPLRPPYIKIGNGDFLKYHSFCKHPNELGYEWIANKIVDGIKENHSKWYSTDYKEVIDWEWCPNRKGTIHEQSIL